MYQSADRSDPICMPNLLRETKGMIGKLFSSEEGLAKYDKSASLNATTERALLEDLQALPKQTRIYELRKRISHPQNQGEQIVTLQHNRHKL
jgi:hypothetical protein